jgi:hypothetical protein
MEFHDVLVSDVILEIVFLDGNTAVYSHTGKLQEGHAIRLLAGLGRRRDTFILRNARTG